MSSAFAEHLVEPPPGVAAATTRTPAISTPAAVNTPWLTAKEAAHRARCNVKLIYAAAGAGKLKVVRLNERRDIRVRAEWVDAWMESMSESQR